MGDYILYIHQNLINGKRYVGITNNPRKRWYGKGKKYGNCPRFASAIKKYGWDAFKHIIVASGLTLEQANAVEKAYIERYRTQEAEFGYNIQPGGNFTPTMLGKHHTEETKDKIRKSALGRVISSEQRAKHSEAMMGKLVGKRNPKSREVRCINTGEVFESLREASQVKGVDQSKITLCCQHKRNHTHGLRWEYADGTEE